MLRRILAVVAGSLALACGPRAAPSPPVAPDERPVFSVSSTEARFVLPVGREEVWRWHLPETRDNGREYRWEVVLDSGETYGFGFYLFKFPGARPGEGTLAALLAAGQRSVWQRTPDGGGRVVQESRVAVSAADSTIVVTITDPWTLNLLFGSRPAGGTIILQAPGRPVTRMPVRFAYTAR